MPLALDSLDHDESDIASLHASVAAHARWSQVIDRTAETAPARAALAAKWERQVDPDGVMDPETRAKAARNARRAHMHRLAMKSVLIRRAARDAAVEERGA